MTGNIYNNSGYTPEPVQESESDPILFIDADSKTTLMNDIKLIRDSVSNTPNGNSITVFVISGGSTTKTVYWDSLFSYMNQISTESEIVFDVLFRGCITLDMLSVFKYPRIQVSIAQSIDIVYTVHSVLRYIDWNPDKLSIIMSAFSPAFKCLDSESSFILKGNNAVLDDLSYKFDIF